MLAELEMFFLQTMGGTDLLSAFVLLELAVLGIVATGGLTFSVIWTAASALSKRQQIVSRLSGERWPVGC